MKKKSIILTVFLLISFLTVFSSPASADQKPKVVLPQGVFNFESVWEGDMVTHDYIVKNQGDAPLEIIKVDTD